MADRYEGPERKLEASLFAAQRYYLHGWTMDAVARHLDTSRSTVSRLLAYARDNGLVEVRVLPPDEQLHPLQEGVARTYGVAAHVVPAPQLATTGERHERTASSAARWLTSLIEPDMIVGVAWGTMLNAVSQCLLPKPATNVQFVQLNGTGFSRTRRLHHSAATLAAFGEAFDGMVQPYPVPVFFDSVATREALLAERSIRTIRALQHRADLVVFSLGTVADGVPSSPYLTGYHLTAHDFEGLRDAGVVGDVATTYYRADGSFEGLPFNLRTSGPDLAELQNVRRRVCVVSGDHKIPALHAALTGRLITDVILDETTARLLLATTTDPPAPDAV
jgi:deoxyribonucleoside regulator